MLFIINTVIIKCILRIVCRVRTTDRNNIFIMYIFFFYTTGPSANAPDAPQP